jgi:iron complex transport system substrate-binding protein
MIASIPDIGDNENGTVSIEKAIAAKPHLVILAAWSECAVHHSSIAEI